MSKKARIVGAPITRENPFEAEEMMSEIKRIEKISERLYANIEDKYGKQFIDMTSEELIPLIESDEVPEDLVVEIMYDSILVETNWREHLRVAISLFDHFDGLLGSDTLAFVDFFYRYNQLLNDKDMMEALETIADRVMKNDVDLNAFKILIEEINSRELYDLFPELYNMLTPEPGHGLNTQQSRANVLVVKEIMKHGL